ncbi:hypothetical protein [Rickettsia felis]|uniref:hypothetical protein n=1 Tax=Rickettsia felis TaxID=42862 RepID=UPI000B2FA658|nr:hypothetical protein [Rickettsia felis]
MYVRNPVKNSDLQNFFLLFFWVAMQVLRLLAKNCCVDTDVIPAEAGIQKIV